MAGIAEHFALIAVIFVFVTVIVPLGSSAIAGFLALVGTMSRSKSSGDASFEFGNIRLSWSGAAGVGLILVAILVLFLGSQH
jgi:hypothetical protein